MPFVKLCHRKNSKKQSVYFVRYYLPGQRETHRQFTIGNVSPRRAKEITERIRAMVIQGVDPNEFSKEQAEKYVEKTQLKLKELEEAYLQHCTISNRPRTLEIKKYAFRLLRECLGNCDVDSITQGMIENWMTTLELSKTAVNMYFRAVRSMFNWAYEQQLTQNNPFVNGRIKQFKIPENDPENYFTLEEIVLIRKACKEFDSELGRLVFLALETGGRLSELLSLQKNDLDIKGARILFRGASTKSGRNRYVPLRPEAVDEISQWQVYSDSRLFRWVDFSKPSKLFTKILVKLNLKNTSTGKRTFHTLRHTYASHLLMSGINIFLVSRWMGHSTVKVTENHYGHLIPEMCKVSLPY